MDHGRSCKWGRGEQKVVRQLHSDPSRPHPMGSASAYSTTNSRLSCSLRWAWSAFSLSAAPCVPLLFSKLLCAPFLSALFWTTLPRVVSQAPVRLRLVVVNKGPYLWCSVYPSETLGMWARSPSSSGIDHPSDGVPWLGRRHWCPAPSLFSFHWMQSLFCVTSSFQRASRLISDNTC